MRKCQPSSWLIVWSAVPEMTAHRSRTWRKADAGRIRCRRAPFTEFQVVLIASHISIDTVSRARRAASRAPPRAAAIEHADAVS